MRSACAALEPWPWGAAITQGVQRGLGTGPGGGIHLRVERGGLTELVDDPLPLVVIDVAPGLRVPVDPRGLVEALGDHLDD
eukprot:5887345-Pyramimonas_sp.AAC.1